MITKICGYILLFNSGLIIGGSLYNLFPENKSRDVWWGYLILGIFTLALGIFFVSANKNKQP